MLKTKLMDSAFERKVYFSSFFNCLVICEIDYSPNVMLYSALKPCLVTDESVVNLILSNVVLSPLTVTVNPDLEPLSLSIIWPKMSVNSTASKLQIKCIQV